MKFSIIIVSFNSEDFIRQCILSVLKNSPPETEVIVVDNNSTDSTLDVLNPISQEITLISLKENLGFAKANNLGAKHSKGEFFFFLNPDTKMEEQVVEELASFYASTPNIGLLAPKLVMADGKVQPSVKKLPSVLGAIKEYIFGIKHAYSEYAPEGNDPVEVEYIYGAAYLIKKDLFMKLGGFDEKYFLYYEDADFCGRIRQLGKKIYYYPGVSIKHLVGGTKSSADKYKLSYQSSIKYHGIMGTFLLQLIFKLHRAFK